MDGLNSFLHFKFFPMVTADIAQLNAECTQWKHVLRQNRNELSACKDQLQQLVSPRLEKQKLQDVEHFQNQFHIQLINVHDLKHAIKGHERIAEWEMRAKGGTFSDATWAAHEDLFDQYMQLENTIDELKHDFNQFTRAMA
jgi:hypothetical protein